MNQTEIPNILVSNENKDTQNINSTQRAAITPKITIIRSGITPIQSQVNRKLADPSPQSSKNPSNLHKVSSSKGIRVLSRQKNYCSIAVSQFKQEKLKSEPILKQKYEKRSPESETSIKVSQRYWPARIIDSRDNREDLQQKMKRELMKAVQKYQNKMNQQLLGQWQTTINEKQKIQQKLRNNEFILKQRENQIRNLSQKINQVQEKVHSKIEKIQAHLNSISEYFAKCNQYTFQRISQVQIKTSKQLQELQKLTNPDRNLQAWKTVQEINQIAKNIAVKYALDNQSQRLNCEKQIGHLQKQLEKTLQKLDQMEIRTIQIIRKQIVQGSIQDTYKLLQKIHIRQLQKVVSLSKVQSTNNYQNKFRQILKKVNKTSIQVQLIKQMIQNNEVQTDRIIIIKQQFKNRQKLLENQIQNLELRLQSLEQEHLIKTNNIKQKMISLDLHQQILEKLGCYQKQSKHFKQNLKDRQNRIKELEKKVSYYEIKYQQASSLEVNLQTSLAEAYSEAIIKQRLKIIQTQKQKEKQILQQKIKKLQNKVRDLDQQNYLLAQKITHSQDSNINIQFKKLQSQLNYYQQNYDFQMRKMEQKDEYIQKITGQLQRKIKDVSQITSKFENMGAQLSQKNQQIQQLRGKLQQITLQYSDISRKLVISGLPQNSQGQGEYNQLSNKYTKKQLLEHIQSLQGELQEISEQNINIKDQNAQLEENINKYAFTFEKQSETFRAAIQKLQKEKIQFYQQNTQLIEEIKSLKLLYQSEKSLNHSSLENSFHSQTQLACKSFKKSYSSQFTVPNQQKLNRKHSKQETRSSQISISRKSFAQQNVQRLKFILQQTKRKLPLLCSINSHGFIIDEMTNEYICDQEGEEIKLNSNQLHQAVSQGILMI